MARSMARSMAKTMGARARAKAWDLRAWEHESRSFDFLLLNYIHLHLSRPSIHIPINWKQAHRSIDAAPLIYEQRSVHEMWKVLVRESVINIVKVIQSLFISSTPGTQPPQPHFSPIKQSQLSNLPHQTQRSKLHYYNSHDLQKALQKTLVTRYRQLRRLEQNPHPPIPQNA